MTLAHDRAVDLPALLPASHVMARLKATDKPRLLAALATLAASDAGRPAEEIAAALRTREALGSTGIGRGVAVPHARVEGIGAVLCYFARLDRPLEFDAIDGKPVDLVFLMLSPARDANAHLATLAAVTRRLRDAATAQAVRAAATAEAIRTLLTADAARPPDPDRTADPG